MRPVNQTCEICKSSTLNESSEMNELSVSNLNSAIRTFSVSRA